MEAVAIHFLDLKAKGPEYLSFTKGSKIKVYYPIDQNWYQGQYIGREEMVPKNYFALPFWCAPEMSRREAEDLLGSADNGEFIVRNSEQSRGEYAIAVKYYGEVKNFKILKSSNGMYHLWRFNTVNALINHYILNPISIVQLVLELHNGQHSRESNQQLVLDDDKMKQTQKAAKQPPQPDDLAQQNSFQAAFDFEAVPESGELNMKERDKIDVKEKINADWWYGQNKRTNEEGLFPAQYVVII